MVRGVTMAMVADEPMLLFWRVEDYGRALGVSRDTGLALRCPPAVGRRSLSASSERSRRIRRRRRCS